MESTLYKFGSLIGLPSLLKYKYWGNLIFTGLSTSNYTRKSAAGEGASRVWISEKWFRAMSVRLRCLNVCLKSDISSWLFSAWNVMSHIPVSNVIDLGLGGLKDAAFPLLRGAFTGCALSKYWGWQCYRFCYTAGGVFSLWMCGFAERKQEKWLFVLQRELPDGDDSLCYIRD